MSGKCWVCKRQARGFGHSDGRFKIADPRRYPLDWVFCSRRCQDIFHALYGRQVAAEERGETLMIDASEDPEPESVSNPWVAQWASSLLD